MFQGRFLDGVGAGDGGAGGFILGLGRLVGVWSVGAFWHAMGKTR